MELSHNRDAVLGGNGFPFGNQVVGLVIVDDLINGIVGTGYVITDVQQVFFGNQAENSVFKTRHNSLLLS